MPAKQSKKEVILETATLLFSQKGYDAAGMDEIARQAGVPKSLIYYHFKDKEELLHAIIGDFISRYEQILETNREQEIGAERYFDFLYSSKEIVRIIVAESLKLDKGATSVFDAVRTVLHHESILSGNNELMDYEQSHARWVSEFFTSIVPFAMFACYADDWCGYFKTDMATAKNDFIAAYEQTHGAYHAKMKGDE